jgi:uridine kinase
VITLSEAIARSVPRDEIRVTFSPDLVVSAPVGSPIEAVLNAAQQHQWINHNIPVMAAICNGRLRELSYPLTSDVTLKPVFLSSSDGGRIYRRSLILLLTTAVHELWSEAEVSVKYAVPDGGYYCELIHRAPPTAQELAQLDTHMRHIVAEDNPITRQQVALEDARLLFAERGDDDKVRLLEYRNRDYLILYNLRNRADYYYGYMVPSTRYLNLFKLIPVQGGFILQYPRKESATMLHPITTYSKLSQVFRLADEWLEKLRIEDVGRLNRLVQTDSLQEIILVAEALHEQNVASIATQIAQRREEGVQIVLIAGPSSSGKTTFARRLAIQLLAHGIRPFTLEMDHYFVDRQFTPRDEHGDYDFEALHALNLPLFNQHLIQLLEGHQVQLPKFDFYTGKSSPGKLAQLAMKQIIILEGIHGLNPELVPQIPPEKIFRIYVSALTQLNIDMHNRVATTDVRLVRRLVRDARTRGYNATDTLNRWQSVRRGEKRNIFPYQENADVMFNSALVYELAALRPLAEPLLLQVVPDTPAHIEAKRLLSFLHWVMPFNDEQTALIPDTSLLREFIGGSILDHYHPGEITLLE